MKSTLMISGALLLLAPSLACSLITDGDGVASGEKAAADRSSSLTCGEREKECDVSGSLECVGLSDPAFGCNQSDSCTPCILDNAVSNCSAATGECIIAACVSEKFEDCDNVHDNGCETSVVYDAKNCGGCGIVCALDHAEDSRCGGGNCYVRTCDEGFADCNKIDADGCEVEIGVDPEHCAGCNTPCAGN